MALKEKLNTFNEALVTLKKSIKLFNEFQNLAQDNPTEKNEEIFMGMRDSMIQRFEYCTDLFLKLLKVYLEEFEKVELPSASPRGIIREAVTIKTISEKEGAESMEMIKNRNLTSHIYHVEVAEDIAQNIPEFYELMESIEKRLQEKLFNV